MPTLKEMQVLNSLKIGNGRAGTDRSNLVVARSAAGSFPASLNQFERTNSTPLHFTNRNDLIASMAFLNQTVCDDNQQNTQANDYCKLLNAAPAYVNFGLVQMENLGSYVLLSTRNHAFSNRDQKSFLTVEEDIILVYSSTAITITGVGLLGAAAFFGLRMAKRKALVNTRGESKDALADQSDNESTADLANEKPSFVEKHKWAASIAEWWAWNHVRMVFIVFFLCCQAGAWMFGYFIHVGTPGKAPFFPFAKGFGKMLDFDLSFILIPVLRNFISFLRTTAVADKLPLDQNLDIHKWTGYFVAIAAIGHITCHSLSFAWYMDNKAVPIYESLLLNVPGLTGIIVTVLMIILFAFAMVKRKIYHVCGRRFDGYKLFLQMHKLYYPIYIILWIHGSQFWQFSAIPIFFFMLEKYIQSRRIKREVKLVEARMVGRDVLSLKMQLRNTKKKFRYKAGQYLFLCCPEINETEFHPFTITSAPEDSYFSCHIRCRSDMDWTYSLRTLLGFGPREQAPKEGYIENLNIGSVAVSSSEEDEGLILKVDGPYGSASEEVFDYESVILVGAGIGVTPFISILKSISMKNNHEGSISIYFYWICRDQSEFDSFKDFFQEIIEIKNFPGKVELNMYVTGELNLKDIKSAEYNQFSGRPNWNRIFKEKAVKHKGEEIGVFLCGPDAIAAQLEVACKAHSTKRSKMVAKGAVRTLFKFHKENF
jgi:NADPH oxidase